jgi:uncharacterized membrane protein
MKSVTSGSVPSRQASLLGSRRAQEAAAMSRNRLEAFSDGVMAVLITIMVLTLDPPEGDKLADLRPLVPKLFVYLLSFVFLAIYWNNHHHLMSVVERIGGGVLWANAHLLFWLSLTPVATAWMGPHLESSAPVGIYGVVLLGSAIAFTILTRALVAVHAADRRWRSRSAATGRASSRSSPTPSP